MSAIDFFDLDEQAQIASLTLCAQQMLSDYGLGGAKVTCINYEFNATFSVESESSSKYALRININSTRSKQNILAEVQWVNNLVRVQGINVPRPIANKDDGFITTIAHPQSAREFNGILYTWLEGEEIGDEPTLEQLFVVGQTVATLHACSTEFELVSPAALPTFDDLLWGTQDFLLSELSIIAEPEKILLHEAIEIIMRDTRDLFTSSDVQIIHGDFHGWNLMWHEGALSVFDFDDCGYGIAQQDLAVALYYLDTPEQEMALLDGYRSIRPLPVYTQAQMASLLLQRRLVLLNYLYETKNREHKEMLPAYFEKTMERISQFLTDVRR